LGTYNFFLRNWTSLDQRTLKYFWGGALIRSLFDTGISQLQHGTRDAEVPIYWVAFARTVGLDSEEGTEIRKVSPRDMGSNE
jgi:hypothetical protein